MNDTNTKTTAKFDRRNDRVTEVTEELAKILETVETGDTFRVHYLNPNGLDLVSSAEVRVVDREHGDVRFGENYLHVNPDTGDYYFQDNRRESPENGYIVTSVTLYPQRDS